MKNIRECHNEANGLETITFDGEGCVQFDRTDRYNNKNGNGHGNDTLNMGIRYRILKSKWSKWYITGNCARPFCAILNKGVIKTLNDAIEYLKGVESKTKILKMERTKYITINL